jgi:hypothetical protein
MRSATIPGQKAMVNWRLYRDEVADNFRVISPKDFRILA